ncbi:hypothetical protein ACNH6C_11730 [Bdellovibrio bacteriovorus]|uniref:hypothetical protein n=1 Tax=Bdellovibrio bacteriovorus TaxID=959 RepID=UPI003A808C76
MKLFSRILKYVSLIASIIFVTLSLPLLIGLIDFGPTIQSYRIDNAEFESTMFSDLATRQQIAEGDPRPQFPVSYHAIKPGKGSILAIRSYHDPSTAALDDEIFWKLTIWMPTYKEGIYDLTADKEFVIFYTRGGSAWPSSMCAHIITSGILRLKTNEISIDTKLPCKINKKEIYLNASWRTTTLKIEDLDYWIGKKGAPELYSETYYRSNSKKPGH